MRTILASASPRREKLLKKIISSFTVVPSTINESSIKARSPQKLAEKLALLKAEDIAKKNRGCLVIGADTLVVLGKKILGKPESEEEAYKMLSSLSGKTHKVITGIAVIFPGKRKPRVKSETTTIKMKKITDEQIHAYIDSGSPMDKAGGYGIQEIEEHFIEKVVGDFDNVVGLPVKMLQDLLAIPPRLKSRLKRI